MTTRRHLIRAVDRRHPVPLWLACVLGAWSLRKGRLYLKDNVFVSMVKFCEENLPQ
jgi:hypothetical protein